MLGGLAALFTLVAALGLGRRAALYRSHRDAGNFLAYAIAAIALVVLAVSFVALPGVWSALGDFATRIYNGGK